MVDVASGGVLVNKLAQVADGFLYTDDEGGYTWLHDAKVDALEEIIDEQQGAPLLVAYRYQAELARLQEKWPAPHLGAGVSNRAAEAAVHDWNARRLPLLYVHPASAGHGLNLQAGGNTIAWYGHTWSREEHDQLIARLRRQGQPADHVRGTNPSFPAPLGSASNFGLRLAGVSSPRERTRAGYGDPQ